VETAIKLAASLQKLQDRAVRILTSSSSDASSDDLNARLGWKKLDLQLKL